MPGDFFFPLKTYLHCEILYQMFNLLYWITVPSLWQGYRLFGFPHCCICEQRTCSPRSAFSSVTISILETSGKWKMVTDRPKSFFQHCVSTSMAETISMLYYDTLTCWLIVFRLCRSMKTNDLIITVVLPKLLQLSVMDFLTFEMVTLKMGTRSVTTISCHPQSVCVRFQLSRSW